ncbi:macrophage mannose receptor 1-like isoform X1 [Channa argus]|uniref:macrophage mannose receptor 1-like isoform X1 n=1 Tax=Channa argus TaxID=215402 RepID=UPI003522B357
MALQHFCSVLIYDKFCTSLNICYCQSLVFCISSSSSSLIRKFHYVNLKMTWATAQKYCRTNYTDLATIRSMEEISRLNRPTSITSVAWIGLNDDPNGWLGFMRNDANSWRWSATGEGSKTGYKNWATYEPNDKYIEYCGTMNIYGYWNDISCATVSSFVCYTETLQNTKNYVFFPNPVTWTDAQSYCRLHFTDLPTIESSVDNANVFKAIPSNNYAWIGLYRLAWKWSDSSNSSFRNWQTGQPDNYNTNQYCVSENNLHEWQDDNCQNMNAFICHQDLTEQKIVKMKIQTSADLMDPAVDTELLQKLDAVLGLPYRTLRWRVQPRKQETEKICAPNFFNTQCTTKLNQALNPY